MRKSLAVLFGGMILAAQLMAAPLQSTARSAHMLVAAACGSPLPAEAVDASISDSLPSDSDPVANPQPTTTIYFTVLLPQRCPGQTFPVVLQSPGYGGTRITALAPDARLYPQYPMFTAIDKLVAALPYYGYVVISFDERGNGQSTPANGGGYSRLIDPALETQDARAILDWAYENAATYAIQTEPNSGIAKDIKVGTLGYSYGGGFQLPLAALDARIDTLIPAAAWHNLLYSTVPGDALKSSWDGFLSEFASTVISTPLVQTVLDTAGILNPQAYEVRSLDDLVALTSPADTLPESVSQDQLTTFFYTHGMGYFRNQQAAGQPWGFGETTAVLRPVPALFVQGNRDVLFNLTEAYWNWRYFSAAGGDVRLMSTEGGHLNPYAGQLSGSADCGGQAGIVSMLAWLDYYLRGVDSAEFDAISKLCISTVPTFHAASQPPQAILTEAMPVGSLSGPGAVPALVAEMTSSVPPYSRDPIFAPVTTISGSGRYLAGIPTIGSLTVTPGFATVPNQSTNAFLGVGILRKGQLILVDDQITAFTAGTTASNANIGEGDPILLPAIGEPLEDGDQVGLLFYERNVQYQALDPKGLPSLARSYINPYRISASDVELPIFVPGVYSSTRLSK